MPESPHVSDAEVLHRERVEAIKACGERYRAKTLRVVFFLLPLATLALAGLAVTARGHRGWGLTMLGVGAGGMLILQGIIIRWQSTFHRELKTLSQ